MKVLVFGASGMVGSRVLELLSPDFDFITPSDKEVDITNAEKLREYLSNKKPQAVVNFAAMTDVDICETERENKEGQVWKVNALAPQTISRLSRELGFFLVQISTDMVFPGSSTHPGPYEIDAKRGEVDELTWYGASKAYGEASVVQENEANAVVRIVYPVRAHFPQKLDYIRKILKLYDEGKLYPLFDDQVISITYVDELAKALQVILTKYLPGIFHVSSTDTTSPYELAKYLLEKTRGQKKVAQKSSYDEFVKNKDPRRYPKYGGLKVDKTQKILNIEFSSWQEIIDNLTSILQRF